MKVSVGVSNRHVHLKQDDLDTLFGLGYKLTVKKELHQPNYFAANETVTVEGPKGIIENVRIIGPVRDYTQVEISKTDAYSLGLNPPVRESGDLKDSSPISIIGPKGKIDLKEGCIIADRHIHITSKQMELYGFKKNQKIYISIKGKKSSILTNIHFKVFDESYYELHLDTDDANANLIKDGDIVDII